MFVTLAVMLPVKPVATVRDVGETVTVQLAAGVWKLTQPELW